MERLTSIAVITDNWPKRRQWMFYALIWLGANAQYIIVLGNDNALHQNALVTLLGAIVAILASYIFGATWDDQNKRNYYTDNAIAVSNADIAQVQADTAAVKADTAQVKADTAATLAEREGDLR